MREMEKERTKIGETEGKRKREKLLGESGGRKYSIKGDRKEREWRERD